MWKEKYSSRDNTKIMKRKGKLLPKMKRSPDEWHSQIYRNVTEIF